MRLLVLGQDTKAVDMKIVCVCSDPAILCTHILVSQKESVAMATSPHTRLDLKTKLRYG